MEQVVRESPGFVWGWSLLADWYPQSSRRLSTCQRAVGCVLAPFYAVGYGHRGATRLRLGDRNGARADWAHALQLDPAYVFGGLSLADLHLEDRELEIARKILQSLNNTAASDLVTAREVRLACLRCDRDAAQGLLVELGHLVAVVKIPFVWPVTRLPKRSECARRRRCYVSGLCERMLIRKSSPYSSKHIPSAVPFGNVAGC